MMDIDQPTRRETKERKKAIYNVIEKLDFSTIYENSPVEVLEGYSVYDTETFKYYINLILVNAGEKPLLELNVRLLCYANQNIPYLKIPFTYSLKKDSLGIRSNRTDEETKTPFFSKKQKQSPYIIQGESFGTGVYIAIPDSYYKKLELEISSVVFGDGSTLDIKAVKGINYKRFNELSDDQKFAYNRLNIYNVAEEDFPIRVIPVATANAWLCCCGQKNLSSDSICVKCKRDRDWQIRNVTDESFSHTLTQESKEVTPEFTHHRKSLRRPTGVGLESEEEVKKRISEYEKTLETIAMLEREQDRKKRKIIVRTVLFVLACFVLLFLIELFLHIR